MAGKLEVNVSQLVNKIFRRNLKWLYGLIYWLQNNQIDSKKSCD